MTIMYSGYPIDLSTLGPNFKVVDEDTPFFRDEESPDDCMNCGMCDHCIERSIASYEEHANTEADMPIVVDGYICDGMPISCE